MINSKKKEKIIKCDKCGKEFNDFTLYNKHNPICILKYRNENFSQSVTIINFLNNFHKPNISFKKWINNIECKREDLDFILKKENNMTEGIIQIFIKNINLQSEDFIKSFIENKNIIYIFSKKNNWTILKFKNFEEYINILIKKIYLELDSKQEEDKLIYDSIEFSEIRMANSLKVKGGLDPYEEGLKKIFNEIYNIFKIKFKNSFKIKF